jgi:hypothetical protein
VNIDDHACLILSRCAVASAPSDVNFNDAVLESAESLYQNGLSHLRGSGGTGGVGAVGEDLTLRSHTDS